MGDDGQRDLCAVTRRHMDALDEVVLGSVRASQCLALAHVDAATGQIDGTGHRRHNRRRIAIDQHVGGVFVAVGVAQAIRCVGECQRLERH